MSRTLQLKTRLAIAGSLLIATTVATGVWSVTAFRRVSRVVGETVTANERMTDVTSTLAGTLEREDDAVLLALTDPVRGRAELEIKRPEVLTALARVTDRLVAPADLDVARELKLAVDAYEAGVDALARSSQLVDARTRYHEDVNPLLRRAVAVTNDIRDQHFRSSQSVAEWAGGQSTRSMQIVATISVVALLLLILVVVHLARVVMRPIGEMTRAVQAIRRGDFSHRVAARRDDELGRLGGGLNRMADELEEFRRTNVGEVIEAKETLEATLEALPDAVLVIDNDRRVTAANPRAIDTLGPSLDRELASLPVPAATRDAVDEVLRAPVDQGRVDQGRADQARVDLARSIELTVGDRQRRLLPRIVPIAGHRGAVLVLSDVTDLARLDEMRLELVAVASHELRTPLTTMRMTLSMLQERASHYEPRDGELVATAMVGIEQLSGLVDEFLDLTRIEAGQLRLQWTRLSLGELVRGGAAAVAPACEQARLALDVIVAPELPASIAGDRARLAMVISNLLSNAIKYTPADGRITVRVAEGAAGTVVIDISDSGSGIPPEYRERVFERFFRVEHERESAFASKGAGIGLYIARQVIEAHGGTIECTASELGGARFVATLPIEGVADQIKTPVSTSFTIEK